MSENTTPATLERSAGEKVSDLQALQDKVHALLVARLRGQLRDMKLALRDDLLVIQGRAKSYYAKQIAQQVVLEAVPGQPFLINEIEICTS